MSKLSVSFLPILYSFIDFSHLSILQIVVLLLLKSKQHNFHIMSYIYFPSHSNVYFYHSKTLIDFQIDSLREINSKNNFIQINQLSYQVVKAHADLYAMGPLVGDNFVRCTLGGAMAITSHFAKTL